jgi:hypothetical protein
MAADLSEGCGMTLMDDMTFDVVVLPLEHHHHHLPVFLWSFSIITAHSGQRRRRPSPRSFSQDIRPHRRPNPRLSSNQIRQNRQSSSQKQCRAANSLRKRSASPSSPIKTAQTERARQQKNPLTIPCTPRNHRPPYHQQSLNPPTPGAYQPV